MREKKDFTDIWMVGIASGLHFLVDGTCICCLYLTLHPFNLPSTLMAIITYNILAFLTQPLTGIVADKMKQRHLMLFSSLALLLLAVLLMAATAISDNSGPSTAMSYTVASLLGMGNSLFHVWGGKEVAKQTCNDIRSLGVFVSTGAVGLAVGFVFYSWLLLCAMLLLMCLLAILYVSEDIKAGTTVLKKKSGKVFSPRLVRTFIILLMAVVLTRSMASERFTSGVVSGNGMLFAAGLTAMSGKMAGGWVACRMGIVKALSLAFSVALVCWFFRETGDFALLAGLFAINLTMPVTLYLANVVLSDREGLAFGLLAAALIPGYLLTQL